MSFVLGNPAATADLVREESGFADALRVLKRHRTVMAAVTLLCLAASVGLIFGLTPAYTATGIVAVSPEQPDPFEVAGSARTDKLDARSVGTEVVALQSRTLAAQVVQSLGLEARATPSWRGMICDWRRVAVFCPATVSPPSMAKRVDGFLHNLQVTPVESATGNSWAVAVKYQASDPVLATKIVNTLIADRRQEELAQQSAKFDRTAAWLDKRSNELRERWIAAEQGVARFRDSNGLTETLAGDKMAPLMAQQIASAAGDYGKIEVELAGAEAKQKALKEALAGGDKRALIRLADEPILVQLAKSFDTLAMKRAFLGGSYKAGMLGPLNREIADVQGRLNAESRRALNEIKSEVTVKQAQARQLQANLASLKSDFTKAGAPLAHLRTLEREAEDASAVYASFLTRSKEMADRSPILTPTTMVLSNADVPDQPSFPKPSRFLAAGLMLGLVGGAGAAWAREKMGAGFKDISRVGADFALPLLSIIPALPSDRRLGFPIRRYVHERPFSAAAESVRSLAAAIALANKGVNSSCAVAISSAVGQEGKSTLCYWLAETAAREGQSVLLVDGDYRKAAAISRTQPPGLTDLLAGHASLDSAIVRNGAATMDYLPSGRPRSSAFVGAELERLRTLVSEMKRRYALVVIDAPPLLGMSEGLVYASVADQSVFVCRWQRTSRAAVLSCLHRLRATGAQMTGIVLSMVDMNRVSLYSDEYDRRSVRLLQQYYLD